MKMHVVKAQFKLAILCVRNSNLINCFAVQRHSDLTEYCRAWNIFPFPFRCIGDRKRLACRWCRAYLMRKQQRDGEFIGVSLGACEDVCNIEERWHGGLYRYYRCTRKNGACSEPYVQEGCVKDQCLEKVRPFGITGDEAISLRRALDAEIAKDAATVDTGIATLHSRLEALQKKLDRLTHSYLDDIIDEDSYQRAKKSLLLEKSALKAEKGRFHRTRSSFWIEPTQEVINALESMGNTVWRNHFLHWLNTFKKLERTTKFPAKK